MHTRTFQMFDCPRFESCKAPICPLDSHQHKRRMLEREPTCHYLRETVKVGWADRVIGRSDSWLYIHAKSKADTLRETHRELDAMLKEASQTGTSMKGYSNDKTTHDSDQSTLSTMLV